MKHDVETTEVHYCKGCNEYLDTVDHCEGCGKAFCPDDDAEPHPQPYSDVWMCLECAEES